VDVRGALKRLVEGGDLSSDEMAEVMREVMTGAATPAQIGGLLVALRMKGETVAEIAGAARTMRALATRVEVDVPHLIDTCGTGGDGLKTFNISTTASFVAAAAGARIAKHGNRSVSSASGSADLLEALGVDITLGPAEVRRAIETVGIGFMFAPGYHGATRHAVGPRRELGIRSLFNVLGPLTNPATPPCQVVGIFSAAWIVRIAEVLAELGSRHVLVVSGADGSDELSIAGPTHVAEMKDGKVSEYTVTPERFGLTPAPVSAIGAASVDESLAMLEAVVAGRPGPARDVVLLNAGASLYVAGLAPDIGAGVARAADAIDSGAAREKVAALKAFRPAAA